MSTAATLAIRPVAAPDAPALAELLNAVIAAGGTTALETPFTARSLAETYLTGPNVHCCFVAEDDAGAVLGFQTLGRYPGLPEDIGDIATFARLGGTRRGIGSATIRADNTGGLAFYSGLGFADHAVTRDMPLKDGTPVDRVHKRFVLHTAPQAEGHESLS